ncbi:unnamed protein product [Effrenium voratum]|uniref:Uncharacterized protein n=1 Tax=Effrenium voratum TaxID=2562239 RepID=A0AA36IQJ2_9DINO|nr:unnamed protein product [Effrenium voratum]
MCVGNSSEFCATCSFLLDGVAHHTVGAWRSNKKLAQRDAAERTLGLFVTRWASLITLDELAGTRGKEAVPQARSEVELLEKFSRSVSACKSHGDAPVSWSHRCEDGEYQAFAEVRLLEVPHTFPGRKQPTLEAAYEDSARRVLWYLQCPGYEDMFEPDDCYVKAVAQDIPEPSPCWNKEEGHIEGREEKASERKAAQVRSRLGQALGVGAVPGVRGCGPGASAASRTKPGLRSGPRGT